MPTRLVLGAGQGSRTLLDRLAETGDVVAVVDDEEWAGRLAERDVPVHHAELTDVAAIRAASPDTTSVVVATEAPDRTASVVAAAREAFPDLPILAPLVPGEEGPVPAHADRIVDPVGIEASRILEHVASDAGQRAMSLRAALRAAGEPLAVVMHDNPDPDAIASAVALTHIAGAAGVDAQPCYFGTIAHQENRALVNLLELDLHQLEDPAELDAFEGIALVDHARPGVNDQLPPDTVVDVVVDHHPIHGPDEARFVDLRRGVGATSTLLTEYFDRLGVELTRTVATALLYGLRVDTDDFTREAAPADFEAAATLIPRADESVLERVESPSLSGDTLNVLARAIERRRRHDGVLTTFVGEVHQRDALAQAADRLLDLDGVTTTVVFGVLDDTVHVSARARGAAVDLGETLRAAFDQLGSAGGHAEMAGAQIPVGMLVEAADEDPLGIVEEVLTLAFMEALETAYQPAVGEYGPESAEFSFLATARGGSERRVAGEYVEESAARLGTTIEHGADAPEQSGDGEASDSRDEE